jgi:hypothetical protein
MQVCVFLAQATESPGSSEANEPKFHFAEKIWRTVVKKSKVSESSQRRMSILGALKIAAAPKTRKSDKKGTIREKIKADFKGEEAEEVLLKANREFKDETKIDYVF